MKLAPISIYDVAAQQAWLEDQAAKGRFLTGYGRMFASFEKGEPKAVRYRLEPAGRREDIPDLERREVYQALGWDYVCTVGGTFYVWRCDDSAAPELDTDPVVQASAYDRLLRQLRWLDLLAVLMTALWPALILVGFWIREDHLLSLVQSWAPAWKVLALLAGWAVLAGDCLLWNRSLRGFVRGLKAGISQPRRRPYRLARCLAGLAMAAWAFFLVAMTDNLLDPWDRMQVSDTWEPMPYVTLAALDPSAGTGDVEARRIKNWMTKDQWCVNESEQIRQGDPLIRCSTRYYRLRSGPLAEPLERSILAAFTGRGAALSQHSAPGMDSVWHGTNGDGTQFLLVRQGERLMEVRYDGSGDLTDHLDDYAAVLSAF